ncbi:MAG TPA: hypothetical protein VE736_07130 [Gaiellaceae bacterium]|jgi:hypothetical protein|nr:hypothetical protein [Gaiellaceae bacterium]
MEPLTNDENVHDEESAAATPSDARVVTGPVPYEVADDDDWED